jgi:hypothetical protein
LRERKSNFRSSASPALIPGVILWIASQVAVLCRVN